MPPPIQAPRSTVAVRRGDIVTVALQGDMGKPRPALVIQSDLFDLHPSITVLPITSELRAAPLFRIALRKGKTTGLTKSSQVMVDKAQSIPREKIGFVCGHIDDKAMLTINRALAVFLGFA
jgi:mRNA interferase MazF